MNEIVPGWFIDNAARRRPPLSKEVIVRANAYAAGFADGKRAGQAELLKIATEADKRVAQIMSPKT